MSNNTSNLSSGIRPIDRLIDSRPIEISDDDESGSNSNGANHPSPFLAINSSHDTNSNHSSHSNGSHSGSNTQGDTFSTVTTPLFQLIRRLNNRRARVANIINSQMQTSGMSTNTGSSNAAVGGSDATQSGDQTATTTASEITLDGDSDASSDWPPPSSNQSEASHREISDAINTGVIFNPFNSFKWVFEKYWLKKIFFGWSTLS